jgi:hypothetical protein
MIPSGRVTLISASSGPSELRPTWISNPAMPSIVKPPSSPRYMIRWATGVVVLVGGTML